MSIESTLDALAALGPVHALRFSRWSYAAVNALHIVGLGLLAGAAIPLALRMMGIWASIPRPMLARVLAPSAAVGLTLAVCTGLLMFATRAPEYAGNPFFVAKLALIVAGCGSALIAHRRYGWRLEAGSRWILFGHGTVSILCWIGAIVCGRLIAFSGGG